MYIVESITEAAKLFHVTKLLFYGATGGGMEWRGECSWWWG